jgi:hypothetical protein
VEEIINQFAALTDEMETQRKALYQLADFT